MQWREEDAALSREELPSSQFPLSPEAAEETSTTTTTTTLCPSAERRRCGGSSKGGHIGLPRPLGIIALVHVTCLLLSVAALLASASSESEGSDKACLHLPKGLREACACAAYNGGGDDDGGGGIRLVCKGLNGTGAFNLDEDGDKVDAGESNALGNDISGGDAFPEEYRLLLGQQVREVVVRDSSVDAVRLGDFARYGHLRRLAVTGSGVRQVVRGGPSEGVALQHLRSLDLSANSLKSLGPAFGDVAAHVRELNLSGNAMTGISPDTFAAFTQLQVLDLSSNRLGEGADPAAMHALPATLKSLDIANNSWSCSPHLAWLYPWSQPLLSASVLRRPSETRCRYEDDSNYDAQLFLVMEYYSKYVVDACPKRDNCSCHLMSVQERMVLSTERIYTVRVDCSGRQLTHFPKLPRHTRAVDLSTNKLDRQAFSILKVAEHNYDEVDNLNLDNNLLDSLPEKLLEMKLGLSFSAKNNKLTSIPYDFSQRLVKTTSVIKLSNNPWKCTCRSQITDLNLIEKVRDKNEMTCGPGSAMELMEKQIYNLNPELLCPPESTGESQELFLKLLCVVLALAIVLLLARFGYDYYVYKKRGQLPWLALRMP